jgi:hypothetical protein
MRGLGTVNTGGDGYGLPYPTNVNEWYYVAFVSDGNGTARTYVNGLSIGDSPYSSAIPWNTALRIGVADNNGVLGRFVGWIDEPAVYNSALTEQQVMNHYFAGLGVIGITQQPVSQLVCPSRDGTFHISAGGGGTLSYQWQIQHTDGTWGGLGNDPGPIACPGGGNGFAFATPIDSPTVSIGIRGCTGVQHWPVRCVVTNACGSVTSNVATLTICPADFNCDGSLNSQDFFDFLTAFFAGTPNADFNADGAINSQDFFDFLTVFFAGC